MKIQVTDITFNNLNAILGLYDSAVKRNEFKLLLSIMASFIAVICVAYLGELWVLWSLMVFIILTYMVMDFVLSKLINPYTAREFIDKMNYNDLEIQNIFSIVKRSKTLESIAFLITMIETLLLHFFTDNLLITVAWMMSCLYVERVITKNKNKFVQIREDIDVYKNRQIVQ